MRQVEVVVPGLFNLPSDEIGVKALASRCPHLSHLLRFADRVRSQQADIDTILAALLGLNEGGVPYAQAVKPDGGNKQVVFRPVHLKADLNSATVFPISESADNINYIISDLGEYFKVDCDIEAITETLWVMSLHEVTPAIGMPHYLTATGKKVSTYLQLSQQQQAWHRLYTEMQMFLHQHPLNQDRLQRGEPAINGLWCWGAESLKTDTVEMTQRPSTLVSNDHLMRALGELLGLTSAPVAALTDSDTHHADRIIIVELALLHALKGEIDSDLLTLLHAVEKTILEPVMRLPNARVSLYAGGSYDLAYRPYMRWRFWRGLN